MNQNFSNFSDKYCILADIGLASQTNGWTTICNQSRTPLKNSNGGILRLDQNSLSDSWNSPTRKEILDSMLSDHQHNNCKQCWDEESVGVTSLRQVSNKKFANITADKNQPRVFMFKPGNVCNLSCRTCNPHVSSKWYRDHYLATVKPTSNISFPEYVRNYDYVRDSFAEENTNLWPTLKEWGKKMVYYDLYGAEPLLIAPLLEMLRHNHDIGVSKNQQIHINTNGTVWHDDFNELFGSFQRVEIGISIDGIEEKFEYMRYPAKWDLILENLKKYQELSLKYPNIEISVCITVSLLNVYYVAEFMNFFHQSGIDCSVNIVNSPSYLDMRIVTTEVKKKIIDKLSSSSYPSVLLTQNANSIINFLKLEHHQSQQLMQEFWEYTNKYDDLRNESYAHTFPEFYKILTA